MQGTLLSLMQLFAAASAFMVTPPISTPLAASRAVSPKAMIAPEVVTNLPMSTIADGDILLPATGGLLLLSIPLLVVTFVVINFGIIKK